MRTRVATLIALFVLGWPSPAVAGPIEFQLLPTGLWTPPGSNGISTGLVPIIPLNLNYSYDPATGIPTAVEVVAFDSSLVPPPPKKPGDDPHWNNAGPFKVTLQLTDADSGESGEFELKGHIHMFNNHGPGASKWDGDVYFKFLDSTEITLGDHTYVIWGINDKDAGPATVHITVEPGTEAHSPEPGTIVLAALGLAPIGLGLIRHRLRRVAG
jgi:hypothetical protein